MNKRQGKKTIVSKAELARIRGVTRAAVGDAIKKGIIEQEPDGKLILEKVSVQWDENADPTKTRQFNRSSNSPRKDTASDQKRYWSARADREQIEAKLARLEFEEKENLLMRADLVEKTIFELCRTTRDRILGISRRVAPMVAGLDDERKIARLIQEELETALKGLTDGNFSRQMKKEATGGQQK